MCIRDRYSVGAMHQAATPSSAATATRSAGSNLASCSSRPESRLAEAWPKPVRYSPVRSERSGSAWMEPAKLKRRGLRSSSLPAESSFWPTRYVRSPAGLHAVARKLGEQLGVILRDGEVPLLGGVMIERIAAGPSC